MPTFSVTDATGAVATKVLPLNVVGMTTAESDWQARITAPGVVWFHDFRSDAEVDAFRWTPDYNNGNDPLAKGKGATNLRRITTDGITGSCMELIRQAGTFEGPNWWRPMSPINAAGNGRGVDDPGAGITPTAFKATDGGNNVNGWEHGYYGNPIYTGAVPNATWDGNEYWWQFRGKIDPVRSQMPDYQIQALTDQISGKFMFQSITSASLTAQEFVLMNFCSPVVGQNFLAAYRSGGPWLMHPGTWQWSQTDWDTIMFHVKAGTSGKADTLVEIYSAHRGDKTFTLAHSSLEKMTFDHKNGWNAVICSNYENGVNMPEQFYLRVCQMIFSKQPIACPQV